MKQKIFFISDLHFGHENILKYRTQFKSIKDHDDFIIEQWNKVVQPHDKVYVLGDVAWKKKDLENFSLMNGTKVLVMGNHDIMKTKDYLKYFKSIKGTAYLDNHEVWLSHAPLHDVSRRGKINIHGHLHSEIIDHVAYINVSCEQVDYTPVELETLLY